MITYQSLKGLPFLGAVVKIANAYAFRGDARYVVQLASRTAWWERILKKASYVAVFTLVLTLVGTAGEKPLITQQLIADQLLGVFPSLLGFGIGVFALVFVLPSEFVRELQGRREKIGFDASILAPDMAYPLLVMAVILFIGSCLLYLPPSFLGSYIGGFALFYGIAMALELVSMIFTTGYRIIHSKRQGDESPPESDGLR